MIILHGPALVSSIPDPDIRNLVLQRFADICAGEAYDYDLHGYMIVVEPGDSVAALERKIDCPILRNVFDDVHFGDLDFSPCFEALEEHPGCFEMVYIMTDEGGVTLFIPKSEGIDTELLSMCKTYAVPAGVLSESCVLSES